MRTSLRRVIGATLLEVMLVLAIAAFIVILSIRYYQSAQTSSGIEAVSEAAQAILAAADSYGLANGGYSSMSAGMLWSALPTSVRTATSGQISTNWGPATLSISGAGSTSYTGTITFTNTPPQIVPSSVAAFICSADKAHASGCKATTTTITWTYTYISTQ